MKMVTDLLQAGPTKESGEFRQPPTSLNTKGWKMCKKLLC